MDGARLSEGKLQIPSLLAGGAWYAPGRRAEPPAARLPSVLSPCVPSVSLQRKQTHPAPLGPLRSQQVLKQVCAGGSQVPPWDTVTKGPARRHGSPFGGPRPQPQTPRQKSHALPLLTPARHSGPGEPLAGFPRLRGHTQYVCGRRALRSHSRACGTPRNAFNSRNNGRRGQVCCCRADARPSGKFSESPHPSSGAPDRVECWPRASL